MRSLYVPLERETVERLAEIAERERRSVKQQARLMIERAVVDATTADCSWAERPEVPDGRQD